MPLDTFAGQTVIAVAAVQNAPDQHAHPATRKVGRIDCAGVRIVLGTGPSFEAVRDLSFTVEPQEFVCVVGPSGCGKSTLIGALAGHLAVSDGRLSVDDEIVRGPSRDRGIVFQHHTLFEWKRVVDNVAFGLKMSGIGRLERRRRALATLGLVGLAGHADKFPSQLSGGMQQRVEIARALINEPSILLMDEPFGALDAQTRAMMQELLLEAWGRQPTTVIFVTHDVEEALFLGSRVIVMTRQPGRVLDDIRLPFGGRRQRDLVVSPPFVELKKHCVDLLRTHAADEDRERLSPLGRG